MLKKNTIYTVIIIVFLLIGFLGGVFLFISKIKPKDTSLIQKEELNAPIKKSLQENKQKDSQLNDVAPPVLFSVNILPSEPIEIQPPKKEKNLKALETVWYKPDPGMNWHLQLTGKINTDHNADVYDIDLEETPKSFIDELHKKGIAVICYFSAGTWENWREDAGDFPKEIIGKKPEDWPGEKWLDISRYEKFADIIEKRMDLAVEKGCDGIDPDNVDGYTNETGFNLIYEDQLKYNKWLAEEAHKRGLAIALKNDLEQVKDLVEYFDFAVNEQCFQYNECELLMPFIKQNKAVFHVEYELEPEEFCFKAMELGFSSLKMNYNLDGGRISCEEEID